MRHSYSISTKCKILKELARFADGIAPNQHKGLERRESGHDRGDGDLRDRDHGRGNARELHHYPLLPAGTCTSHNSSAPVPVESRFPAPVE